MLVRNYRLNINNVKPPYDTRSHWAIPYHYLLPILLNVYHTLSKIGNSKREANMQFKNLEKSLHKYTELLHQNISFINESISYATDSDI